MIPVAIVLLALLGIALTLANQEVLSATGLFMGPLVCGGLLDEYIAMYRNSLKLSGWEPVGNADRRIIQAGSPRLFMSAV